MWSDYWNSGCIQILRPFGPQDDIGAMAVGMTLGAMAVGMALGVMMIPVGLGDDYGKNTSNWGDYERKYA